MRREEAIAFLEEVVANKIIQIRWISLVDGKNGYEIHIKPEIKDFTRLKPIVEKHNLALKEVNGVIIIHREHDVF